MRTGNHTQAAVLFPRRVERDPRSAGGERSDRPVVPVLVERRLQAVAAGLEEPLPAPEDDVAADGIGDELDQLRVARQLEEVAAALHAFAALLDMRAHQLLGTHARVV